MTKSGRREGSHQQSWGGTPVRGIAQLVAMVLVALALPTQGVAQHWLTGEKNHSTFADAQQWARQHYNLDGGKRRSGWKQYARWQWLASTRLDSKGRFDPSLSWKTWQTQVRSPGRRLSPDRGEWTSMGPAYKPEYANAWGTRGLGRVSCVAFDPRNHDIIWVGAPSGGLWRSPDGGQTWEAKTDHLPNIGVTDILIHPEQPQVMYLALGDGDGGDSVSTGMLRTDDGGLSWQMLNLGQGLDGAWWIHKLLMHSQDPDVVFAATSEGVFRTTDAGQTWDLLIAGYFKDIEMSPADSAVLYASRWGWGVYRSENGGDTWQILRQGLPSSGFSRISLAVTPASPRAVYASYADSGGADPEAAQGFLGLYRSLDGGDSWTLQASSPNLFGQRTGELEPNLYSLGNYAQVLVVDPSDASTVYAGSVNLWKSTDGGRTWSYITNLLGRYGAAEVHVDHHALKLLPGSSRVLYDCNDGGLHRSEDGGITWTDLSNGLVIRQIYRVGVSHHHPDHFIIGAATCGRDHDVGPAGQAKTV
jgi:photosystem II stability/assembly factor-like uncharacterized protein